MITGARSKRDLTADLRLETPAKSQRLGSSIDPNAGQPRGRPSFAQGVGVTVSTQGLSLKSDAAVAGSNGKINTANLRASANVATWRTYLPEDCVAAMNDDGWHWTT
jgi:hypothetical protein